VSAVHALRPVFPGREAWITGGFGLVHGLAFGSLLATTGAHGATLAATLLGFNLGIEVMQCGLVLAFLPVLGLWVRAGGYRWLRRGGATFALLAATCWSLERGLGTGNPMASWLDAIPSHAPQIWAVRAVAGAVLTVGRRLPERLSPWRRIA
jgi:hypothetical protein